MKDKEEKQEKSQDFSNSNILPYKNTEQNIYFIRGTIAKERQMIKEMIWLLDTFKKTDNLEDRRIILSNIVSLKDPLKKAAESIIKTTSETNFVKPLLQERRINPARENIAKNPEKIPDIAPLKRSFFSRKTGLTKLEDETLKRLKKRNKLVISKKIKKPSVYVKIANKIFADTSKSLIEKGLFESLKINIIKSNLQFVPTSYVSVILFTTLLSFFISIFILLFFLLVDIVLVPFSIGLAHGDLLMKFMKLSGILFIIPLITYLLVYFYPEMEKKSTESRINRELPFAVIHMAAISGSMIDPTKMFQIIASTEEYPYLEKEFTKLMNEINIYGYDLISALRRAAVNCPSAKLADLYNGLAITINSGGDFSNFFDKRSESLLFDYKIEKEKTTKSVETFMDIYISVVIAAPMILMLLVMMMKISGLGISLSTNTISIIMVIGVSMLNVIFLAFLYLKQPNG